MQTILGANGVIANNLSKHLPRYTNEIRLVSRNPKKINDTDQLMKADLLDAQQTADAIKGSKVVYLTAGIPYRTAIWRTQWPIVMQNVIDGCKRHNARLVFFSNVYPYGLVKGKMTEETPFNPCSKKGEIRATIETSLLNEVKNGNLQAQIVRAADFYGPHTPLSYLKVMVFDNLAKGKKAQWFISDQLKHSFTYTPDAGKATALLGNTDHAYNQVWHLPTDQNTLTGKEFMDMAAKAFGVAPNYMVLKKWMVQMAGLFIGDIKEMTEMLYQNEHDYLFDSSKFEKAFDFKLTTYQEGLAEVAQSYR
ncbi:MAG TPA: NAD-dependent dehydratase [Cytophagales bacterium]|nr:NAD-dependent dehydratase [Cytophagales bacterium]HCR55167.1 NAD-dependent dehydratase [Cytophagales bacterium]